MFDHTSKHWEGSWTYDVHIVLLTNLEVFRINIVLSVWYNLSIETKTKDRMEKENCKKYEKLRSDFKSPLQLKFSLLFDEKISLMRNSDHSPWKTII